MTSASDVFSHRDRPTDDERPDRQVLPLGAALGVGLFGNCFGGANALVRREAFDRIGGFTEDWGVGFEDWEFYARVAFAGLRLEVVAEPLYWYRSLETGMARTTNLTANLQRALRPYLEHTTPQLHGLLRIGQAILGGSAATLPDIERFDLYWDSTSWRITRLLRQIKRRRAGLPPETKPQPETQAHVAALLQQITSSLSWKLTRPLRAASRVTHTSRPGDDMGASHDPAGVQD